MSSAAVVIGVLRVKVLLQETEWQGIHLEHCWLVGCFGFNGPFRQYFSLPEREGERRDT